ncbi:MAG TPA: hypothetical protein VFY40_02870, partial [Blastocatellia bacterium]|nr:hypothetical protein [Blastocatellia bacterium]
EYYDGQQKAFHQVSNWVFQVNRGDRRWGSFGYLEENVNQIAPFSHLFARNGTSQPPKLFSDWAANIYGIEFKRFSRAVYTLKLWPDNRYYAGRKEPGTRSRLRYLTYPVVGKK